MGCGQLIRVCCSQDDGAAALREYVEEEARDLQGEAFTRFMDTLFERISGLVARSEVADNLGAVRAIDQLIGVQLGENATKISRFANYLRQIFEEKGDPAVMVAASVALGHLAREGGALTADVVEFQVRAEGVYASTYDMAGPRGVAICPVAGVIGKLSMKVSATLSDGNSTSAMDKCLIYCARK